MIPREILKKIRQIKRRTNRLVTETLAATGSSVARLVSVCLACLSATVAAGEDYTKWMSGS
ncbi:MAG TPA: hypothetical protein VN836_02700, partial [Verrucomicrobiae bacterium]|nr:hypothetical protein [Verrucomicrobiae bacterium]